MKTLCWHGSGEVRVDTVSDPKIHRGGQIAGNGHAGDRFHVLHEAIMCCRKAGTISVPGVYL